MPDNGLTSGQDSLLEEQATRPSEQPILGLLTKTITYSPVIRWILPARIRHKDKDDLIFVGEDVIHIKQIHDGGHLRHVATKADFDCRILSAKVLGQVTYEEDDDSDSGIKAERNENPGQPFPETTRLPPQCLVLVLETHQLVFMYACEDAMGSISFEMTSNVPLPAFPSLPQQLGKHLAVDPRSRAVAVAAAQDNVFLYSVEPMGPDAQWGLGMLPVSHERPLARIRGIVQAMDFLYPPDSDPDQVILLLIVVRDRKTFLIRVIWDYVTGIQHAQYHNPLPILKGAPIPNLLIPIRSSAAFILTVGPDIWVYTNILTGHIEKVQRVVLPECDLQRPGSSPLSARWVAWARPRRNEGPNQKEDYLYLAREDGDVFYFVLERQAPERHASASHVNNFNCHIDSAFACYGNQNQNDFFAIGADMSDGAVHGIMPWPESKSEIGSEIISTLPNWTATFDLVASKISKGSDGRARPRDALFVSGGRQPYGRLSELRSGIQARSGAKFPMLQDVVQMWNLPLAGRQELLILLSRPDDSKLWRVPLGTFDEPLEQGCLVEVDEDIGIDLDSRTLAAAMVADDCIMQVTVDTITLSQGGQVGVLRESCPVGRNITAAAIDEEHDVAVTAVRENGASRINLFRISMNGNEARLQSIGSPATSVLEILSAAIFKTTMGMVAVFGTSNASLLFYGLTPDRGMIEILTHTLVEEADMSNACEDIVALTDFKQINDGQHHRLMLLCGLRDGTLHAIELLVSQAEVFSVQSSQHFVLGFTSVKLKPDTTTLSKHSPRLISLAAYATCGGGLFKITWKGASTKDLTIADVWITDAEDPSLQQGAVTAFAMVPFSDCIGEVLPQSLIVTCGDTAYITKTEANRQVVPRSLMVQGTPNRVIYSHSYGCFITVAAEIGVHPSQTRRGLDSRSIRPVIEFRGTGSRPWRYVHELEPGSRIYSITEWIYRDPSGKKYAFVALGSGPIDNKSPVNGEIILLQPVLRDGVIEQVRPRRLRTFDTAVYSLAPYGACGLVACTNPWIYMFEYQPSDSKFTEVCRFRPTHPGVYVTTAPPMVHVSTNEDSLLTLQYSPDEHRFSLVGADSIPRKAVFHLTLDLAYPPHRSSSPDGHEPTSNLTLNLLSTRDRHVVGQIAPTPETRTFSNAVTTAFDGITSRSLVRLRKANVLPPWKAARVAGIVEDRLIGTSVDGTLTGLAILEGDLAHRLRWVQRLCERSKRICPMAPRHSMNVFDGDMDEDAALILPPRGFDLESVTTERSSPVKPADMHIDGDVLQRLLDRGGVALLRQMLEDEAKRKDRIGDWVRENLDAQLEMTGTVVEDIRAVLDRWW
ncbi:hypothetical protein AAFC00_002207 [Neodothiora populina]|uniref:Cleavage/polyadenylation specificity factor A subunit N-terminal domain-containing protein n=1 Tax=Neodothiora populina TaxID=2781224 RepID=A0ABR3PGQ9_9PEZI